MKKDGKGMASISWRQIQLPKEVRGLGVGDLIIKNVALLFKWWWRFSLEDQPLWKKIVSSSNDIDTDKPLWKQKGDNKGGTWSSICSIWRINKEVEDIVTNGLWVLVRDGRNTLFWKDLWISDNCLKECFPRLYSISSHRGVVIVECGF